MSEDIFCNKISDILITQKQTKVPVLSNQFTYYSYFEKPEIFMFHDNVTDILGYSKLLLTNNFYNQLIHPQDKTILDKWMKKWQVFYQSKPENVFEYTATVDYRIKTKQKGYLRILQHSNVVSMNEKGLPETIFYICTDISHLQKSGTPDFKFSCHGNCLYLNELGDESNAFEFTFSNREKEVLKWLSDGFSSKEIAKKLSISKHTVDTHRRKMLRKTNIKNTTELIKNCIDNGII